MIPSSPPILCPRCTADTQLDARDPRNPKRICACGWSVSAAEIEHAAARVARDILDGCRSLTADEALALLAMGQDDDLAQHRTGPDAPVAPKAIGSESIPALLEQIRELAWRAEYAEDSAKSYRGEVEHHRKRADQFGDTAKIVDERYWEVIDLLREAASHLRRGGVFDKPGQVVTTDAGMVARIDALLADCDRRNAGTGQEASRG
jgi:hypothetical protein